MHAKMHRYAVDAVDDIFASALSISRDNLFRFEFFS